MEHTNAQQELSIIKQMVEKTRKDTAESGRFFLYIGIVSLIGTITVGILEAASMQNWLLPALVIVALSSAAIAAAIMHREKIMNPVKTYAKAICWHLWLACGCAALLILFVFPFLRVYSFSAVPVLICVIMGIALYSTGIVLELPVIQWSCLVWITGAILLTLVTGLPRIIVMSANILLGWIVPGCLLNRTYRQRSSQ